MEPLVSIIMPFYNCHYINQAIQSALNQTYKHTEIIVIDDGSTVFTEKITPFNGRIKYIRKENGGTATALNHGIQAASGEYIAWLSSDDFFYPEKLSKQLDFMLKHHTDVSFTNFEIIDENNKVIIPWCGQRFSSNTREVYEAYLKYNAVNGCTVVLKKDILNKIGYFNPIFRYTHDYEMWLRLLVNGYEMMYLDDVLTKFRRHDESGTSKYQTEMQHEMSILERYYRPILKNYLKNM